MSITVVLLKGYGASIEAVDMQGDEFEKIHGVKLDYWLDEKERSREGVSDCCLTHCDGKKVYLVENEEITKVPNVKYLEGMVFQVCFIYMTTLYLLFFLVTSIGYTRKRKLLVCK